MRLSALNKLLREVNSITEAFNEQGLVLVNKLEMMHVLLVKWVTCPIVGPAWKGLKKAVAEHVKATWDLQVA
jgi:hypothetical protein